MPQLAIEEHAATVPFVDLKAQGESLKTEVQQALNRVLDSSIFTLGEEVAAFEREFAAYCGTRYAIAVNSGTSALHLALLAAGVGPGDEVITVPFTFVATVAAILYTGGRPVFVDIDPQSFTIDVEQVERAITARTKAILPVHLYGQTAEMEPLMEIARRHGLVVIEDAAQAHGAEYRGCRAGSLGHSAGFSFYPAKNLGAFGESGAVTTDNADYARTIRMLRDWGQEEKYEHALKGYNYRMDALQGAILRVKLRHLDSWNRARRGHARLYTRLLSDSAVTTPREMPYSRHVHHLYVVRTGHRDFVQLALRRRGIQTGIHYPIPVHLQKAYADCGYEAGDFPRAERAANTVLSLPMFPELSRQHQETVADALHSIQPPAGESAVPARTDIE